MFSFPNFLYEEYLIQDKETQQPCQRRDKSGKLIRISKAQNAKIAEPTLIFDAVKESLNFSDDIPSGYQKKSLGLFIPLKTRKPIHKDHITGIETKRYHQLNCISFNF